MSARWTVCQTKWNQERLALENLGRQGFETYLPLRLKEVRPRGQPSRVISLPFFPRYIFVRFDQDVNGWRAILSTRGVEGLLNQGDKSGVVLERLLEDIRRREVKGFVELAPTELECPWKPGDKVAYGAIRDAIFQERVDERRCKILVSLLGTASTQVVDIAHIE